jgi:hypothetical protein
MNEQNKQERLKRVLARGEHSNHSHVLFGDIKFLEDSFNVESSPNYDAALTRYKRFQSDELELKIRFGFNPEEPELFDNENPEFRAALLPVQDEYNRDIEALGVATVRHILESNWLGNDSSVWTKEHVHVPLHEGVYQYIPQIETNPLNGLIRQVED